jgi:hypothetical protein
LEWLNSARADPVAALTRILNQAGSDSVIAGFMAAENPITAAQLEAQIATDYQTARQNSAQFPTSEAISQAPLVFYPLFQQQAKASGAAANPPAVSFPSQRPPPAYIYPVPFFNVGQRNGSSNVFSGPDATGGTATFGPYGSNATDYSQANLYASYITPREWILTQLTGALGSWSPPPAFLLQGDSLPNLTLGHIRMVGIDVSAGQNGNQVLTLFKANSEFLTQSDLPFGANTVFITGVAYRDGNSNGVYDPGEGVSGVEITTDHGSWYAVTSTSGGYAIPVAANSGRYTVTAAGGPFNGATTSVTVGSDSVKADWVLPAAATVLPAQVTVPVSDGTTQLVGLSTRGLVQDGDNVLIGGFVIAGPTGVSKKVLIRGVGPSLQTVDFPASECIPATQLKVYSGSTVVASNNGWTMSSDGGAAAVAAAAKVGDFPLLNWAGGGGDSALVTTLSPGAYTVIVSPAPGTASAFLAGYVGLVEIYDLTPSDGSRFVNISTRGLVGTGDFQMIVGCTVAGNGHERMLIRGVGPGLGTTFGLAGTLANPSLTLYDNSQNVVAANDDWSDSAQTDQIRSLGASTGAFALPEGSIDSSIIALQPPGNYTAIVGAKPGTTFGGLALVELYEAP